jgi:hypothetical protein
MLMDSLVFAAQAAELSPKLAPEETRNCGGHPQSSSGFQVILPSGTAEIVRAVRVITSRPGHDCFVGGWRDGFTRRGSMSALPLSFSHFACSHWSFITLKSGLHSASLVLHFTSRNTSIAKKNRDGPGDRL